jgi:mycofactocin system FadH/OYE family oxidoreductase 1
VPGLTEPIDLRGRTAPSRVVFGPHETNLARAREFSDRHVAYYARRAAAGVIVTEAASVHESDWPYERAPVPDGPGWASVKAACGDALVLAGLAHAGGQGSSAYSQRVLWAPSRVADAISREPPAAMEAPEIAAVVDGFASAAARAVEAGLDGVELDAGPISLLRQFHSGLTNLRADAYGEDRLRFTREVIAAVRAAIGDRVLALRLSCDELAPWAGVTPEQAARHVAALSSSLDLLTVVRGGPFSTTAYRPDAHTPPSFNRALCAQMRAAAACPVVLQGSVVSLADAQAALDEGVCDLVEMTRAQIAEPRLVELARSGGRPRPCIRCNQACRVRDPRNPLVSCVGEPSSGHELEGELADGGDAAAVRDGGEPRVLVVGAGPAGLECARVLALHGRRVKVVDRRDRAGGVAASVEKLAPLAAWLQAECRALGVQIDLGRELAAAGTDVVLATGARRGDLDALAVLEGAPLPDGPILVDDPIGGPIGIDVAERLAAQGRDVALVTQDQIAGSQLSLSGDLADANVRLQRAGVHRVLRARITDRGDRTVTLQDVWTGASRTIDATVVIDCGPRLPDDALYRTGIPRAGDCIAPRTVLEAVLEGRRRALELTQRRRTPWDE